MRTDPVAADGLAAGRSDPVADGLVVALLAADRLIWWLCWCWWPLAADLAANVGLTSFVDHPTYILPLSRCHS